MGLILNRRVGEKICIGNNIVVSVYGVRGKKVQIYIEAPREVAVWREEKKKEMDDYYRKLFEG